jgi:arginine-tRNA-protein transferase
MDRVLKECALDEECSYIDGNKQTTHYKIIEGCSVAQCDALIERGWRRFGNMFFRPICQECTACESIKIDVPHYTFSKSERRIMKKCGAFTQLIQQPTLTRTHLDLFNKYHEYMKDKRGWDHQSVNARNYYMSFVHGYNDFGYEVLYFDEDRLIAVDLIDMLPNGISSIYFYYDPDYAKYSLGKYSMLQQIELARKYELEWIYLGYYVESCQSLMYKKEYAPYLTLEGRPEESDTPHWYH